MKNGVLVVGSMAILSVAIVYGQAPGAAPQAPRGAGSPPQTARASTPAGPTAADERALVDKYCVACHSTKGKAAGLDSSLRLTLDDVDFANVQPSAEKLEKVARKLRAGMMPPVGMPRPEPALYKNMLTFLQAELDRTAPPYMPAPGLHRLNHAEYRNAIKDLLNLEIDSSKYLPSDDSTRGFDNIAGALGISSTLVEAYGSAAQKISRLALGEPEPPGMVIFRAPEDTSQNYHIEGLPLGTRGGLVVNHVFPSDGEYTLTVLPIFGDNQTPVGFGSVPCERIELSLDGERLEVMDWRGGGRVGVAKCRGEVSAAQQGGQTSVEAFYAGKMVVKFKAAAGPHTIAATFLETNFAPVLDFERQFERATVRTGASPGYTYFPHVGSLRLEGPYNATRAEDSPSRRKIFVCRPTGPADETACARRITTTLATQAFRRPVTAADVALLMKFYEAGRKERDFELGIDMVLERLLASPQFIYRIEEPTNLAVNLPTLSRTAQAAPKPPAAYRVSDIALASRLSFFLWSRGPDEALMKIASEGRLRNPVVLDQQVRRMLKDPRSEALTVNFAGQWLNLRDLQSHAPIGMVYPDFDDPLRDAERREVELLFDSIVREDRSVLDLLTADYTFVNQRLARHYGIPNVYGSRFRRVTLGPDMDVRRGLLGKGAFLTMSAKPERTSPVARGKWIMTNLLGMSPPDPPPNVPPLPPAETDSTGSVKLPSMRMKMLSHRVRADCIQCHSMMDPIGFALENFDGIASWRTEDNGNPVDPTGTVFDGTKIDGPASLRNWLVKNYSNAFVEVAAEKLLTYALGRGVEYQDMPLVRSIARDAARSGNRFSTLVLGVVNSPAFQINMKVEDTPALKQAASR